MTSTRGRSSEREMPFLSPSSGYSFNPAVGGYLRLLRRHRSTCISRPAPTNALARAAVEAVAAFVK